MNVNFPDASILIVDDQQANVDMLVSLLQMNGYTNLHATTEAQKTVELFEKLHPDLILLDLMMPHMDGFQVMEQLKTHIPPEEFIPILVLTADTTTNAKLRALAQGARDFLTKPLDIAEVTLRINNLLQTRYLHLQQQNQNQILEERVKQRTSQLERQFRRLAALREIDVAITSSLDLRVTLRVFVQQVISQLEVDAAAVLLLNSHSHMLTHTVSQGFRSRDIERTQQRLGEGHAGLAAWERRLVHIPNLAEAADFRRKAFIASEDFVVYFGLPLIAKGEVKGVLEVYHRAPLSPDTEWLSFLEALAGQAAIAIDNANLFNDLHRSNVELQLAYDATIEGWSRAMDLRDRETEGHTQRVTEMTISLARMAGMENSDLVNVKRGALLHDMGKLGIPDAILLKPGPLTAEEWAIMKKHPEFAFEMLSPITYLHPALDIPYCHHEKWDGSGYPRGLKGAQIPLVARLFAVVDVWDALRSNRPYRAAWPEEEARQYIRAQAGAHFDPQAVELFFRALEDKNP